METERADTAVTATMRMVAGALGMETSRGQSRGSLNVSALIMSA